MGRIKGFRVDHCFQKQGPPRRKERARPSLGHHRRKDAALRPVARGEGPDPNPSPMLFGIRAAECPAMAKAEREEEGAGGPEAGVLSR